MNFKTNFIYFVCVTISALETVQVQIMWVEIIFRLCFHISFLSFGHKIDIKQTTLNETLNSIFEM